MQGLEWKTLGKYELRQLFGSGGMANVYKGYDPSLEQEIAVKVFNNAEERSLFRFIREAHTMRSLHNDHLVSIYDSGSSQIDGVTWYYIIMPFMRGGNLQERIGLSPLSLSDSCIVLRDIADALDYVHSEGIVHRDIKPSNVLLDTQGRCYLADFGIAQVPSAIHLTTTGGLPGTWDYLAPELLKKNPKADARSDLYSLGVLLFEMITGQLPFGSDNPYERIIMRINSQLSTPSSIASHIPTSVDHVVLQALAKEPEQRYGSATELANTFCRAIDSRDVDPNATWEHIDDIVPSVDANQEAQAPATPELSTSVQSPIDRTTKVLESLQPMIPLDIVSAPSHPGGNTEVSQIPPPPSNPPVPLSITVNPSSTTRPLHRRRWRTFIVALITLIILLLIIIPIIGSTINSNTLNNSNATATAQSWAGATATSQKQATESAIAAVTATTQARASATVGPLATATSGTPTYVDTLNNSSNSRTMAEQWDGADGNDSQCSFNSDGYHVKIQTLNLYACKEAGYQYGNAAISVDVTIVQGDSGGLFLRFGNGNGYNGYLFEIDSVGRCKFSSFGGLTPLQDWTFLPALKVGYNVTNTIAVIMKRDTFALYINGTYITTLSDPSSPSYTYESGYLALFASAPYANTEVVFSNLKVWQLI